LRITVLGEQLKNVEHVVLRDPVREVMGILNLQMQTSIYSMFIFRAVYLLVKDYVSLRLCVFKTMCL